MRSLKLSGLIRRNPDRPSLKQRAASLKATATKVLRRPKSEVAPISAPSDLAASCDWAIAYRVWTNRPEAYAQTDDELDAELAPLDAVMNRAITEPSADIREIQAKARLLIDDLIQGGHADEQYDDARLTLTVLREIIAFPSVANGGGAEGDPQTNENAAAEVKAEKALPRPSSDADQSRRAMVAGSLAAVVPLPALAASAETIAGTILGAAPYKTGRDLTAVAEAWIDDASDIGMHVLIGPDGEVWRAMPVGVGERYEARDAHWHKLNNRPPLLRPVHAIVKRRSANHG